MHSWRMPKERGDSLTVEYYTAGEGITNELLLHDKYQTISEPRRQVTETYIQCHSLYEHLKTCRTILFYWGTINPKIMGDLNF